MTFLLNKLIRLWRRLLFHARRNRFDRELEEEMRFHLELKVEENIAAGISPEEARPAAQRQFGNQTLLREVSRDMWSFRFLETLAQDLRYGARMMRKSKMFTLVAVLSLALGIGANTAIFSMINALMLRTLPVKNAQELALFSIVRPSRANHGFNYTLYETFRDVNQSFTDVIAADRGWTGRLLVNEPGAGVEYVQEQRVSGNFFSVLGVDAVAGRMLIEADDNPFSPQTGAVISYEYWRRRFGLDPQVVGQRITVNDVALTIVGVAPPGFYGFEVGIRPELWWPIKADNSRLKGWGWLRVIGRLRPGVSMTQAQVEMETIFQRGLNDDAARYPNWTPEQRRNFFEQHISLEAGSAGHTDLRREFRQPLFILMAAVGLTLLIACVNVANLLLARGATRRKEIAVRLALGAGRFRLLCQLLTESVLLSLLGGAAGLLFARVFLRVLITYLPQYPHKTTLDVSSDALVLAFTLLVSVLTGLLFGLAPGWQATRLNLTASLKDQTGASASRSRLTLNKALVVTQVALSLFLLIGAGLFARSLRNLRTLDAGLNYENIVWFRLDTNIDHDAGLSDFYKRMLSRLESLPGAQSVTLSNYGLLEGGYVSPAVSIPGYTPGPGENMSSKCITVGPRFFETMKMTILAGRDFGVQDERPPAPPKTAPAANGPKNPAEAPPLSAVVSQTMARYFFGNENPVGKHFLSDGQPIEIIGVARDSKHVNLREQPQRVFYLYYFQVRGRSRGPRLQLRVSGEPVDYAATIERLARELDPHASVAEFRMMRDLVDAQLTQERFIAQLGSAFSLFALLLACVGLYGVMSYTVARRTNEIGIRMALGARGADVIRMVIKETMLMVAIGMAIGLGAALATTRLISNLLFELSPYDPSTIVGSALLMAVVAALAGYLPAKRASRVDPMTALRCE